MENKNSKRRLNFTGHARQFGVRTLYAARTKGKQNMIIIGATLVLMLLFFALNQNFLRSYNIVSMAQSLAPYAILALGVTFVIATGVIDLSIGTVCIASAVLSGYLYSVGMPLFLVIPVSILIGSLFGLLNGVLVAKLKLPAFIATLGTMMFARGLSDHRQRAQRLLPDGDLVQQDVLHPERFPDRPRLDRGACGNMLHCHVQNPGGQIHPLHREQRGGDPPLRGPGG